MRLGAKHQNQREVVFSNFAGGLNTSSNLDGLAENQLADALNVEVDTANGRLKTVAGTVDLLDFENIFAGIYDEINDRLLLIKDDKSVYEINLNTNKVIGKVGTLSGDMYPISTRWENDVLLASGGKLQYFNGTELVTIADSPICTSVYVRAGRVLVTDENNVRYSGEYPNLSLSEVSRNVDVRDRLGVCAIADSVFVLGRNEVQSIQTTNAYGDMKPADMSPLIAREIQSLPANTMLRYLPSLNQIWAIAGADVMVFDLRVQNWYKRQFNSPLIDAIPVGEEVLILKKDRVGGVTISLPAIDDKNSKRKKIPDELSRIKSMLHFEPI